MKTILNHFSQTLNLIKAEDITETVTSPQNPTNTKSGLQYTLKGLESRDDATRKLQPSKAGSASSQESPNPSPEPSTSNALKSGNRAKERVCFMLLNKNKMQDIQCTCKSSHIHLCWDEPYCHLFIFQIRKLLKMLEIFMKPTIQQEAGPLLISMLEEIRKADTESLRAVYREVFQTATSDNKQLYVFNKLICLHFDYK